MIKKYGFLILIICLVGLKVSAGFFPFLKPYVSLGKIIPFLFFFSILQKARKESLPFPAFLAKSWYLFVYLVIQLLDIFNISVPYVSENIFYVLMGCFGLNLLLFTIKYKSYSEAVGHVLPEHTANISKFETKLMKGMFSFFLKKPAESDLFIARKASVLNKVGMLVFLVVGGICYYVTTTVELELVYKVLIWLILPYACSWPLGIYGSSMNSCVEEKGESLKFRGLYDFDVKKTNIVDSKEKSELVVDKKQILVFSLFGKRENVLNLIAPQEIVVFGRKKKIAQIIY
jgi:hypothetical protein